MRKAIAMMRRSCRCSSALAFCVRRRFGKTKNVTKYVRRHFGKMKSVTKYVRRRFGECLQPPTKLHKLTNQTTKHHQPNAPNSPPKKHCLSLERGSGGEPFFWHKRKVLPRKKQKPKKACHRSYHASGPSGAQARGLRRGRPLGAQCRVRSPESQS